MAAEGPFPGGTQGAVSLTFDDGLASQRARAVPLLERSGLRGTFYLNPRGKEGTGPGSWRDALEAWRSVGEAGHELGNHTVGHPCARNFAFAEDRRTLERMTIADIEADVDLAEARLGEVFGPGVRSFAYPCYQDSVGEGEGRRSYVPVIARRFLAARTRGERPNDPGRCDLHHLWSFPAERMTGAQLVGLCEQAAATSGWTILTFHGVGDGGLPVAEGDLAELCAHLCRQWTRLWTAPVAVVAKAMLAWRGS